jgi:benzil reductase ((S)-benzoin forming)
VVGISRGLNAALARAAEQSGAPFQQWECDLADGTAAAERLSAWLAQLDPASVSSLTLINNAALMSPVQPLHTVPALDLVSAIRVGLEAPVLLTQAFLASTQLWVDDAAWGGDRRVLQISSGLGRSAMASVGSYCAIKAGLDSFSASVALDQKQLGAAGAKVVSLAPGIIATDMQVQLRSADAAGFPDQSKFIGFHESGALDSPVRRDS